MEKENITLQIEYLNVDDLVPYERNAREHHKEDVDMIVNSIKQFGFNDALGIWHDNLVVEGHGRLLAAKKLGMKTVPCVRLDHLTDEERRAYALAHNKTAENSMWNLDFLGLELDEIKDIDMMDFGFDLSLIHDPEEDAIDDDYEVVLPEEPKSKRGEIYALGSHRLMCGDATNPDDIQKLLGGGKADLYLTDPPYNVDYEGATKDALKIMNDNMEDGAFRKFLDDSFAAANAGMRPGAVFYIWHADSEGYNFRGACRDVGWKVRQCLIWEKNQLVMGLQDYQWMHEPCLYGWSEGAHSWYSDRKQTTILHFDKPQRNDKHPTMKPIPLFDYLMKNSSEKGDIILDTFAGSGTTIMACEQNGRKGYCMELDPRYVDVIIDRWEEFTGKKAVLITEGDNDDQHAD